MIELQLLLLLLGFNVYLPVPTVNKIILRNHLGETMSILPKRNGTCSVSEAEHESIVWNCSDVIEVRYRGQRSEVYYWTGSGKGGIIGGGWRIKN